MGFQLAESPSIPKYNLFIILFNTKMNIKRDKIAISSMNIHLHDI